METHAKISSPEECARASSVRFHGRHYDPLGVEAGAVSTGREDVLIDELAWKFWSTIDHSGSPWDCWIWKAGVTGAGYGLCQGLDAKRPAVLAHRLAFDWSVGIRSEADEKILHACDVPLCCNPYHLRRGTQKENQADRWERKRCGGVRKLRMNFDAGEAFERRFAKLIVSFAAVSA